MTEGPIIQPHDMEELRKAMGFRYRDGFALMLGVSRQAVEHWEYGRRQVPVTTLLLLGYILDKHFPKCDGYLEKWKQILRHDWERVKK